VTMPRFVVGKVTEAMNQRGKALKGAKVLVLGLAYKKDIDDVRESPALDIIRLLEQMGAKIQYHDPFIAELHEDGIALHSTPFTPELVRAADCVVVVTDHSSLDYAMVAREARAVVDTRHIIADRAKAKK